MSDSANQQQSDLQPSAVSLIRSPLSVNKTHSSKLVYPAVQWSLDELRVVSLNPSISTAV